MANIGSAITTVFSVLGIMTGQAVSSFMAGYKIKTADQQITAEMLRRISATDQSHFAALTILGQQNQALTGFVLSTFDAMMKEFVLTPKKELDGSVHEISCKTEHMDLIRKLMDETSEKVVKELASWGTSVLSGFDLKFEAVSLEPDVAADPSRAHDVLIIFRVIGDGENALRFQAAAARKLADLVQQSNTETTRSLRPEVRWS